MPKTIIDGVGKSIELVDDSELMNEEIKLEPLHYVPYIYIYYVTAICAQMEMELSP